MAIDNLKIAESIKKLQESILGILELQAKSQKSQLDISKQLAESIASVASNSSNAVDHLQKTQESIEKAAAAAEKLGNSKNMAMLADSTGRAGSESKTLEKNLRSVIKTAPQVGAFAGMWEGFTSGIQGSAQALGILGSMASNTLGTIGQLAVGIISFPFKILSGIIDFASKGGGDSGLRQALEDIRKEFGSLKKTSGGAIVTIARNMKGELANTGLSTYRVFGNLAEKLKAVAEYAKNLGPLFGVLSGQFVKNGEALGAYFKGLGLTETGQKAVANRAYALGQDMTEVTRQLTNYSTQLGDQFGLSAKEISRDMGDMMGDFEHFGGMAPQVLAQVSVYARRLGVDVKGLLGVIDKFDNFEDAATSAAQLTQAFGIQVDALEMLKDQDPASRTERLRKAFFAAGRSVEGMTRQERALLTAQTGLDASSIDLAFSAKNQGLSYDQVKKKSEGARKSQLTQEEAISKLSDAIERMVKSGSGPSGGFFERFIQGFERGITRSHEFRKVMINIRMALRQTYRAGAEVGRMFVDIFPGVEQVFKGIAGIFDPTKFRKMTETLKGIFRQFFTSLTGNNSKSSFSNLMENLKTMFWNYFDSSSSEGRGILDGVKNFAKAAVVILAGMIGEVAKGLTKGITYITDLLSGRTKLGANTSGAMGFIVELFGPIVEAVKKAYPPIVEALTRLFEEEVWPRVKAFLWDNALVISAVLFGPGLFKALAGGLATGMAGALSTAAVEGAKGIFSETAKGALKAGIQSLTSAATSGGMAAAAEGANASVGVGAASKAAATAADIGSMLKTAAVIGVGIVAIMVSIALMAEVMKARKLTPEQMLTSAATMAIAGLVVMEIAASIALLSSASQVLQATFAQAITGLGIVAIVGAAMMGGIVALVWALSDYQPSQVNNALKAMIAGGAFILAVTGVILGSIAIGTLLLGTGGAGAVAMVAGLGAIAAISELMVIEIENIIDEVGGLNIPSNFDRNFQIFTDVLGAVGTFGGMIAQISEATSHSSFAGWITGSGADDQIRTLESLKTFMSDMSATLKGIVATVLEQVHSLNAAPEELQKAELFSTIMGALGQAAHNLIPPDSFMRETGIIEGMQGQSLGTRLIQLGSFIQTVTSALSETLKVVVGQFAVIGAIAGVTPDTAAAFEVVGDILSMLGQLASNLMRVINTQYNGATQDQLNERLPSMTSQVTTLMNSLFGEGTSGLISAIGRIMTLMSASLSGMSSGDITKLKTVGPILTGVFGAIATVGNAVAQIASMVEGMPAEARGSALGTMNTIITQMIGGVAAIMIPIMVSARTVFAGMKAGDRANITAGVSVFKGIVEGISILPTALKSLQDILRDGEGNVDYSTMSTHFDAMLSFIKGDGGSNSGVATFLSQIGTALAGITQSADQTASLKKLSTNFSRINETFGYIKSLTDNINLIKAESATTVQESIVGMVASVNEIHTSLGAMKDVNITTQLKTLAGNLGLGSNEEFTITNRNFNIKVNLEVKIDAAELERVLVGRPDTTIQHT